MKFQFSNIRFARIDIFTEKGLLNSIITFPPLTSPLINFGKSVSRVWVRVRIWVLIRFYFFKKWFEFWYVKHFNVSIFDFKFKIS